jgi:hypothetical protein
MLGNFEIELPEPVNRQFKKTHLKKVILSEVLQI